MTVSDCGQDCSKMRGELLKVPIHVLTQAGIQEYEEKTHKHLLGIYTFPVLSGLYTRFFQCTHAETLCAKEGLVSPEKVEKVSICNWGRGG